MARYNEKLLPYSTQEEMMDMFCETLSRLRTRKAIRDFLKDLLNRQERTMLVRRLMIAEMLLLGATYREIVARLHCGTPTIARVERWLSFGREGYIKALAVKGITKRVARKKNKFSVLSCFSS